MENKEITYVDSAIKDLLDLRRQIEFVIDIMGGYGARLNHERENFRSFLGNIGHQITEQIVFLSDVQRAEQAKQNLRASDT